MSTEFLFDRPIPKASAFHDMDAMNKTLPFRIDQEQPGLRYIMRFNGDNGIFFTVTDLTQQDEDDLEAVIEDFPAV